ncbi:GNAT family N-acetyltransferase [Leptospira haakeii]|uniref:GNAT family N-acetyltransferase n=1 Tax=Leptospira haakeii TaxID=2023198 RepID=A0ABX4PSQ5_9LEPT|nr:GNAT family N-acetyltransferase [Leptospira haakeii]PKA17443.1 GNAT family N-acetyltransferase [Leptospira haakeii]PKA21167.1 GNAT family N-acetyltransferase [Leptospira haakeii]
MQKENSINVRIASRSDLEELSELFDLYRKFYELPSNLAGAKKFLEDRLLHKDSVLIVAEDGGRLLGFAQLYPIFSSLSMRRDYILNDLYIRETERRRGTAKKILAGAANHVMEHGGKGMGLETHPDNRHARHLYERFGFKLNEEYLHYYWAVPKEK